jgi:hypothetical protein
MRLRFVRTCNFGKSELTNFIEIIAKHPEFHAPKSKFKLKADDVVLLVSMTGNQLVFLHGFDVFDGRNVLRSTRLRVAGGHWNPLMLANYAKSVGIPLAGLKEYEDHIKELTR